ncbi:MAG: universal stress protein [Paludibacter sp.]|nr:universal stress protein [Paludibacter sp.]
MNAKQMKKVLIALDYDPTAQKVAESGFAMAKAMGAEVTLLHVMVSPAMYASAYANMGAWQIDTVDTTEGIEIIKTGSRNLLEKAKKHLGAKTIKTVHKEGDTAQMILQTASEIHADCIVMGTHSQKWLENVLMGSVTEEVLRKTTIPMFIVPTKKRD